MQENRRYSMCTLLWLLLLELNSRACKCTALITVIKLNSNNCSRTDKEIRNTGDMS